MSWLISFGLGCAFFILIFIGIYISSALGCILRGILDKMPEWFVPVVLILCLFFLMTLMFHVALYGGV